MMTPQAMFQLKTELLAVTAKARIDSPDADQRESRTGFHDSPSKVLSRSMSFSGPAESGLSESSSILFLR